MRAPVHCAERALDKLGRHSQHTGEYHPEHRARSAGCNCYRHAADVANADSTRHGSGQSLKVRDLPRVTGLRVVAAHDFQCVAKATHVNEAQADREVGRAGNEPDNNQRDVRAEDGNTEKYNAADQFGHWRDAAIDQPIDIEALCRRERRQ